MRKLRQLAERGDVDGGGTERKRGERCEIEEAEAEIEDNDARREPETIDCNQDP